MSLEYVERRINEALKLSKGNATKARQIVIKWCQDDIRLLHGMTKAHLNGIVAYNIERVASGRSAKAKAKGSAGAAPHLDAQPARFSPVGQGLYSFRGIGTRVL